MEQFMYGIRFTDDSGVFPLDHETEQGKYDCQAEFRSLKKNHGAGEDEIVLRINDEVRPVPLKNGWTVFPQIKLFHTPEGYFGEINFLDKDNNQIIKKYASELSLFKTTREDLMAEIVRVIDRMSDFYSVLDAELHLIRLNSGKTDHQQLPKDLKTLGRIYELYEIFQRQEAEKHLSRETIDKINLEFQFILNQIGQRLASVKLA